MALKTRARGTRLYIDGVVDGKRVRKSTNLAIDKTNKARTRENRNTARLLAAATEIALVRGDVGSGVTVSDAASLWAKRPDKPGVTSQSYVHEFVEAFGKQDIADIDEGEVVDHYLGTGKAISTIRREMGAVQSFLNWACKASGIERQYALEKPDGAEPRLRFLSEDEVSKMLSACPRWFEPMMLCLFYMGLRRGEAMRAKWGDIDANGDLTVTTRKGRKKRLRYRKVPIHPVVKQAMGAAGKPDDYIFTKKDGSPFHSPEAGDQGGPAINKVWKQIADDAGVKDCTPHDARRTFASMLLDRDVDVRTIADLLGHTSLHLLMIYAQVRGRRKEDKVALLPDLRVSGAAGQD